MNTARKPRDWFQICSWIALILIFAGLVRYVCVHAADMLDSDMSSEMVLGKLLQQSGGILSKQWYYSTEIRVLNTQLIYSAFFHLFDDWQTVRILSNVTLYLVLLASYFFLCKRLKIARYFPLSAAILLLPLSAPYFYIFLYGAYYIPRISMMFVILGIILPATDETRRSFGKILFALVACLLSLALGLEGARMLLILFVPLAILTGGELLGSLFSRARRTWPERRLHLRQSGFSTYFWLSFFACALAVAGFLINQKVMFHIYPFEQTEQLRLMLSLGSISSTLFSQRNLIGYNTLSYVCSTLIWIAVGGLYAWYLLQKGEKSLPKLRFVWLNLISWACYTAFCCLLNFGQVAWHIVPVAVLFIPGVAVVFSEVRMAPVLRRILCVGLIACLLCAGVQGYSKFESWGRRSGSRTSVAFQQIADTLEEQGYRNGYATFWFANVLTELSDGAIDVWCVEAFDEDTAQNPDINRWLQVQAHDTERPTGKTFVVWSADEYATYGKQHFSYLGEIVFQNDAFVVFDVK